MLTNLMLEQMKLKLKATIEQTEADCVMRGDVIIKPDTDPAEQHDFIKWAASKGFDIKRHGSRAVQVSWFVNARAYPTGHMPMARKQILWLD